MARPKPRADPSPRTATAAAGSGGMARAAGTDPGEGRPGQRASLRISSRPRPAAAAALEPGRGRRGRPRRGARRLQRRAAAHGGGCAPARTAQGRVAAAAREPAPEAPTDGRAARGGPRHPRSAAASWVPANTLPGGAAVPPAGTGLTRPRRTRGRTGFAARRLPAAAAAPAHLAARNGGPSVGESPVQRAGEGTVVQRTSRPAAPAQQATASAPGNPSTISAG